MVRYTLQLNFQFSHSAIPGRFRNLHQTYMYGVGYGIGRGLPNACSLHCSGSRTQKQGGNVCSACSTETDRCNSFKLKYPSVPTKKNPSRSAHLCCYKSGDNARWCVRGLQDSLL